MKSIINLVDRNILVTGASSGIGRQTAITLSEVGAKVILTARSIERLEETTSKLSGSGHAYYNFDLENIDEINNFLLSVTEKEGKFDGLVYCAGIDATRPYKSMTPDVLKKVMHINFFAFYEMARQFARKKISNDGAKITVVSSIASEKPDKGQAAYAASKAAIDTSIISLSKELMPRNININSVRPGFVRTPLSHEMTTDTDKYNIKMQPMGLIEAKDVAFLIAFMQSSAANMITGRAVDIDGGGLHA